MKEATLIFPHQLFENHPAVARSRPVFLTEEFLFFRQYNFHQQKLAFHRASMKAYEKHVQRLGCQVSYIESTSPWQDVRELIKHLRENGVSVLHYVDVTDNWLSRHISAAASTHGMRCVEYDSPSFLLDRGQVTDYFGKRKRFLQGDFYIQQRKRFNLLLTPDNQPQGGQWSFDKSNRKKYPGNKKPPAVAIPKANPFWMEASGYVQKHFPNNPGRINTNFTYPTTFEESRSWLNQFLESRLEEFGPFEDAIVARENILHHSVLTPMLNTGLLTPQGVLDEVMKRAGGQDIPLNSLEGFVRQIAGWREFIRGIYTHHGCRSRSRNFWKFNRTIPPSFWDGTTGILPVDTTIRKVLDTGYCHHIERLMVLGNFMLLCEFDPDEVYRWFMEMFIDAYDWVMVPNVYGMSQFADGGLMATKPYISGSNYVMKMSDYPPGDWQDTWDALFWRFLDTHRGFFQTNPRLGMLVRTYDKMKEHKRFEMRRKAEAFLHQLDSGHAAGADDLAGLPAD